MVAATDFGRQPLTVVEIDQDFCALTYGVAPCTAEVGVTGDRKCFNTRATCQDTDNYDRGTLTLRFCTPHDNLPRDINLFPTLVSASTAPTEISIGGSDRSAVALGRRASVTIELTDHPYHDRLVDPYWAGRDYDPMTRGTFWAKWIARNPYYIGRALRVRDGYVGQSIDDMPVRNYVIERIEGPHRGRVKIVAKDPLSLLNAEKSLAPRPSNGRILSAAGGSAPEVEGKLAIDIDSITLTPTGVGSEYPELGLCRVGNELFGFTRSGDVLTIGSRGQLDTIPFEWEIGDAVQRVYYANQTRMEQIIYDLISLFTDIPLSFINFYDWTVEGENILPFTFGGSPISEPTSVGTLIGELLELGFCMLWWDERTQQIRFRALDPLLGLVPVTTVTWDNHIIADSFSITPKQDEWVSRLHLYHTRFDRFKMDQSPANFLRMAAVVNEDAESDDQYGLVRIKEVFTRWLHGYNHSLSQQIAARMMALVNTPPDAIEFRLDAKDRDLTIGDVVDVEHYNMVDFTGLANPRRAIVVAYDDDKSGHSVKYKCRRYGPIDGSSPVIDIPEFLLREDLTLLLREDGEPFAREAD